MNMPLTAELLDSVAEHLMWEGLDAAQVQEAARRLRAIPEDPTGPLRTGEIVVVSKGPMAGKVGHAVIGEWLGLRRVGVRLYGTEDVWFVEDGYLERVDLREEEN